MAAGCAALRGIDEIARSIGISRSRVQQLAPQGYGMALRRAREGDRLQWLMDRRAELEAAAWRAGRLSVRLTARSLGVSKAAVTAWLGKEDGTPYGAWSRWWRSLEGRIAAAREADLRRAWEQREAGAGWAGIDRGRTLGHLGTKGLTNAIEEWAARNGRRCRRVGPRRGSGGRIGRQRMERARALRDGGASWEEVATLCGYGSADSAAASVRRVRAEAKDEEEGGRR